ncbi:MAG: hypothetical protein QNJ69_06655 [Gammaproteobacteria bacterium]|nr:hypothetical protein [Gammaproteobacteria bacterium]
MIGKLHLWSTALAVIMLLAGQLMIMSETHARTHNIETNDITADRISIEISDLLDEQKSFVEAVEIIHRRYKEEVIENPELYGQIIFEAIVKSASAEGFDATSKEYNAAIELTNRKMIIEYRIPEEIVVNVGIEAKVDVLVLTDNLPPTAAGIDRGTRLTGDIGPDLGNIIKQPTNTGGTPASRAF